VTGVRTPVILIHFIDKFLVIRLLDKKNSKQYLSVEICCSKLCFNSIVHIYPQLKEEEWQIRKLLNMGWEVELRGSIVSNRIQISSREG
jgi:hypothetical protein